MKIIACLVALLISPSLVAAETISVSAAVSLKEAVTEIAKSYESQGGDHIEFAFGASGQLAAQIKAGAPVDLFISAANKQIEDLSKAGDLVDSSRTIICGNQLVLIVPADSKDVPRGFAELAQTTGKLAVGEPKTVPAGQYAAQVLDKMKLTAAIGQRLVYSSNVRQVLDYVERGEVAAGIVYATDAQEAGERVKVVATADAGTHEPIVYPAAIVKGSMKQQSAEKFLTYLTSEKGLAVLVAHGFSPVKASAPATAHSN